MIYSHTSFGPRGITEEKRQSLENEKLLTNALFDDAQSAPISWPIKTMNGKGITQPEKSEAFFGTGSLDPPKNGIEKGWRKGDGRALGQKERLAIPSLA